MRRKLNHNIESSPSSILRPTSFLLALILCLGMSNGTTSEGADSVYLKTGELFSGDILRINKREVSIQLESGGILHFRNSQIDKVKRWVPDKPLPEVIYFNKKTQPITSTPKITQQPVTINPFEIEEPITIETHEPEVFTSDSSSANSKIETPQGVIETNVTTPLTEENSLHTSSSVEENSSEQIHGSQMSDWTLKAPKGFQISSLTSSENRLASWMEPSTQALVNLFTYKTDETIEDFKNIFIKKVPGLLPAKVYRDIPLNREGPGGFKGWIIELEQNIAGAKIRQLSLVVQSDNEIFVLRMTAPASTYKLLTHTFEQSLHSFRLSAG